MLLPFLPAFFFGVAALGLSLLAALQAQPRSGADHLRLAGNRAVAGLAVVSAVLCAIFLLLGVADLAAREFLPNTRPPGERAPGGD